MKIAVILPVHSDVMLTQPELMEHHTPDVQFELFSAYNEGDLRELNTAEDVAKVTPYMVKEIQRVEREGFVGVVIFSFGDFAIEEVKAAGVRIPVICLGKAAVREADERSRAHFTVIPSQLAHNPFVESLINKEGLSKKFVVADKAINKAPTELRTDPDVFDALKKLSRELVTTRQIDVLTLGCGGFYGMAQPLQDALRKEGKEITVIDPIVAAFCEIQCLTGIKENPWQAKERGSDNKYELSCG